MPVIFRNADTSPVVVSLYNQTDSVYIWPLKSFTIPPRESFFWHSSSDYVGSWDEAQFQVRIEFQTDMVSANGNIYSAPTLQPTSPPTVYDAGDRVYLIDMDIPATAPPRVIFRRFVGPSFAVTKPASNGLLDRSREGDEDVIETQLDLRDWHVYGLPPPNSASGEHLTGVAVRFEATPVGGGPTERFVAESRDLSRLESDGVATFATRHRFQKAGPVQIRAILESDGSLVSNTSASVSARVAPTRPRQFRVEFLGRAPGSNPAEYPAVPSIIQCELSTEADHFFEDGYSVEYRFGRAAALPLMGWSKVRAEPVAGAPLRKWRLGLPVSGDLSFPAALGNVRAMDLFLEVKGSDAFKEEVGLTSFDFLLADVTPPEIKIDQTWTEVANQTITPPVGIQSPDSVYVTGDPGQLKIWFTGTVKDRQSHFKQDSFTFSIDGAATPVAVNGDSWQLGCSPGGYGAFVLRLRAEDNAGNIGTLEHYIEVVSSYRPADLDELLSPQSYLRELLRVTNESVRDGTGGAVTSAALESKFGQPFPALYLPGSPTADESAPDLLVPVRLLRSTADIARMAVSPLIGRWSFTELADGATDGLIERFEGFPSIRLVGRYWSDRNRTIPAIGPAAKALTEKRGYPLANAFGSDGSSSVEIGVPGVPDDVTRKALRLGADDRDFALSLWVYPLDEGDGNWRSVLFKGDQSAGLTAWDRTPSIWLHPMGNRLHFRISTDHGRNEGGDSAATLAVGRWSHIAYVKQGRRLSLYIDGQLDTEVRLSGTKVLDNDRPLYLGSNPWYPGFKGGISEFRIYGVALGEDEVRRLAADRSIGIRQASEPNARRGSGVALDAYCRAAHAALLRGIGTSVGELRGATRLSPTEQAALERRLGLGSTPGREGEALAALLLEDVTHVQQFEIRLTNDFGLPPTIWDNANQPAMAGTPLVLWYRQCGLESEWVTEDALAARWPDLDPDLVDYAELDPAASAWRALHIARSGELAAQFDEFITPNLTPVELIDKLFDQAERDRLLALKVDDAAGRTIADGIAGLSLDLPMFRRLLTYLEWPGPSPLSAERSVDLAHLLVEVWKRRERRAIWLEEEGRLPIRPWPSTAGNGAWIPGSRKMELLPWRSPARRRAALEERLEGRHRDWREMNEGYSRLLIDVQRETLPSLRDDLLGISDLPGLGSMLGALDQHLLTEFAAAGARELTAADQAAASLQVLLNGIRQGWFGAGHPASVSGWHLPDVPAFDAHWANVDSLAGWRAAVLNAVYVENTLYPNLRRQNTAEFKACLKALRALQPLTADSLDDPTSDYGKALQAHSSLLNTPGLMWSTMREALQSEASFFIPVAEGLALQRTGLYKAARERYRRVIDVSLDPATRRKVEPVMSEPVGQPARARLFSSDWTTDLDDPHGRASLPIGQRNGCANPYTRFVLFQILRCLLDEAAEAHSQGTVDGIALARSLYLEAEDILAFAELEDVPPSQGGEAYLPNPALAALRAETASALRKLRLGLSYLGTPLPPDPIRGAAVAGMSNLVRPTPYSYRVLIERAKQYAGLAQQFEAQYLSALERSDAEVERLMREGFAITLAEKTEELRDRGVAEAKTGKTLAEAQQRRSCIEADRYAKWLAVGDTDYERQELAGIGAARDLRQGFNVAQTAAAVAGVFVGVSDKWTPWTWGLASSQAAALVTAGVFQGSLIAREASNQTAALLASRQRRDQEWQLRRDIAEQDFRIGQQSVNLADARIAIADQEAAIARAQTAQSRQMYAFVANKFTSAEFYEWLSAEWARAYSFFLRISAVEARNAELTLAFQRQQRERGIVRLDYWRLASVGSAKDRKGITGSALLLQDIYELDQYALNSEKRMLNLTQSFSLSQLMPVEFEEFRRTGVLPFATPMSWFDAGFPGHYQRLIKRVRLSVAALVPPAVGIRASLSHNGLSRVVTADPGYPTVIVRQDPQSVALTSPGGSTGVFELDPQPDLLHPFEGSGVDGDWVIELPPAANPFDYDSLLDVIVSIDYTASYSPDLRDRVVKTLPRDALGQRMFSLRRDLPDVWYELVNQSAGQPASIDVMLTRQQFPPGIDEVMIRHLAVSAHRKDGTPCAFTVTPRVSRGQSVEEGAEVAAISGLTSSRQSGAMGWRSLQGTAVGSRWSLRMADDGTMPGFLQDLQQGDVEDILVVFGYSATRPPWRVV